MAPKRSRTVGGDVAHLLEVGDVAVEQQHLGALGLERLHAGDAAHWSGGPGRGVP